MQCNDYYDLFSGVWFYYMELDFLQTKWTSVKMIHSKIINNI